MEGKIKGLPPPEMQDIANILGENVFSEDFGVLLIKAKSASIKIFSSGHISVNASGNDEARSDFEDTTNKLIRVKKCTKCGVCLRVCPLNANRV